jgi:DNA (cytosine-5)-methyltransferase 1
MKIRVFDFFSGCGGTSCGFKRSGMEIAFGLDIDPDSGRTFRKNFPEATFLEADIRRLDPSLLTPLLHDRSAPVLFCGCAPCQPFSKQNKSRKRNDPRMNLLAEFGRFIGYWKPDYVFVENVPGLQRVGKDGGPLRQFARLLAKEGYSFASGVVPALWFGVPQKRERLVLLASLSGRIDLPKATHGPGKKHPNYSTVRDWIGDFAKIRAGMACPDDPDHEAAALSPLNLKRISLTPEGGGRESWPRHLWLKCHKNHSGHSDVYGRLNWDAPASGLTTRCISYSNGRFGHPEQDRALSAREAACLQTFPRSYRFVGTLESRARQIGNAVPPLMALRVGQQVKRHFASVNDG